MKSKKKNRSCARFVIYVFPLTKETTITNALDDLVGEIVLPEGTRAKFQSHDDLMKFMEIAFKAETLHHRIKMQREKFLTKHQPQGESNK